MNIQQIDKMMQNTGTTNETIFNGFAKANSVINHPKYKTIICSISGGSDSDIVLDICHKIDVDKKIKYVWFDTGLEYQATKDHLNYLEQKYNIEIQREKAIKSIPLSTKEYGQPFLSKYVSDMMSRLQRHNFNWEDEPFEELLKKYPKCRSALKWWTGEYTKEKNFSNPSRFDIAYNKHLKDFIVQNPPQFSISDKCCTYAKKNVSKEINRRYSADLMIIGIRRAEGGIRSTTYKNCFTDNSSKNEVSSFRPIFYYTNYDKKEYEKAFGIQHSKCYTEYGMKRTGCAGCPFNRELEDDMAIIEKYEPKLYKAINNIFKDSYEYTKKYKEFYQQHNNSIDKHQTTVFDFFVREEDANGID